MTFDKTKFTNLVLYVIWKTGDVRDFGLTKLNKVLWFSDARAFEALGKPITGETYIRRKFGPVPRHINEVLGELSELGKVQVRSEAFFDYEVRKYSAFEPPDISCFSRDELGFIDWWVRHVAGEHTAVSISEKSHDYGWKIVKEGEELPYRAFLAQRLRAPVGEELEWARKAASEVATN